MNQAIDAKRERLYRQLKSLHEEDLDRVSHYAAFLQYLEAQEDEEDAREAERVLKEIEAGRMKTSPWEEVRARLDLED